MKMLTEAGLVLISSSKNQKATRHYDAFTSHGDWIANYLFEARSHAVYYAIRWKLQDGSQPYYFYIHGATDLELTDVLTKGAIAYGFSDPAGVWHPAAGEYYNGWLRAQCVAKLNYEDIAAWLDGH